MIVVPQSVSPSHPMLLQTDFNKLTPTFIFILFCFCPAHRHPYCASNKEVSAIEEEAEQKEEDHAVQKDANLNVRVQQLTVAKTLSCFNLIRPD